VKKMHYVETPRDTYARCHVVLYKSLEPTLTRRVWHIAVFRSIKKAFSFYKKRIKNGDEPQLFIEPPMLGGGFTTIDLGEDDL
jgi:hypothetical protein